MFGTTCSSMVRGVGNAQSYRIVFLRSPALRAMPYGRQFNIFFSAPPLVADGAAKVSFYLRSWRTHNTSSIVLLSPRHSVGYMACRTANLTFFYCGFFPNQGDRVVRCASPRVGRDLARLASLLAAINVPPAIRGSLPHRAWCQNRPMRLDRFPS